MKYSLRNVVSLLNNISAIKPNTSVNVLYATKIAFIEKYNQPITTQNIKDTNSSP